MVVCCVLWSSDICRVILSLLLISNVSFALSVKCSLVIHCVDEFAKTSTQNVAVSRNFDLFATCLTRRRFIPPILWKGFTSSRINYYPNSVASYQVALLLRSSDVEPNPGPRAFDLHVPREERNSKFNGLLTFYANVRSIVNKRSRLELDIAVSRYDIIALTKTHLDNSISDSEILPNNYLVFRRDRQSNGHYGGGVLIAVRNYIKAFPHESLQRESEFIFIDILVFNNHKITFGVFYRPPNNETKPLEDLQIALQEIALKNDLILVGDFNLSAFDWENTCALINSANYTLLLDIVHDNFLPQ